ncbi:hypothetical protein [Pseudoteredinibacter isoporae]|uniref:hypothetical protein n=1 Tax=Pseudoteredinibacter isoporae TaxID=570281 RepID=UPI00310A0135
MSLSNDLNELIKNSEWTTAVGSSILLFGRLEVKINYLLFIYITPNALSEKLRVVNLSRKIELIRSVFNWPHEKTPKEVRLIVLLKRASGLLTTRNLIAHNGLMWGHFDDESSDEKSSVRLVNPNIGKGRFKSLALHEIQAFVKSVEELLNDFEALDNEDGIGVPF